MNITLHKLTFTNNLNFFFKKLLLFIIIPLLIGVFSIAKADTSNVAGITKGHQKVTFKPDTRRINEGAEESVSLDINGNKTDHFIVELDSSNSKIVSLDPDSKRVNVSGSSTKDIKIIAKKEGIATITAIVVRPSPAKQFDSSKGLPSSGKTPIPLSDAEGKSLEQKNGFQQIHASRMHTFAQEKGVFLIVRDGNPDSVVHFSNPDYMPKPMSCKAKTAKVGPNKGIVVNPIHETQKAAWDKAIAEAASTTEANKLREQRQKAVDTWKKYGAGMLKKGYRVNKDTGVIEYVSPTSGGKVWKGIHGDYDLHGVYRKIDDEVMQRVNYGDGVESLNGEVFRSQLNQWLTGNNPKDFIQHGGQDDWKPDPTIIAVKPPDPPAVVFFPDGRAPKRLETAKEMKEFYENQMAVRWPYKKGSEDTDNIEVKAILSVKVINLEKENQILTQESEKKLLEESKKNKQKLQATQTPQLPPIYTDKDYTYVYIKSAMEAAAESLEMTVKQLPQKEGYALLPSSNVFETINKDRNFTSALIDKINFLSFNLSTKETLRAKDVKLSLEEIQKIASTINDEYKQIETKIINKAFSTFVTEIVKNYPDMRERLISVQAFYDLYKKKEKEINLIKSNVTKQAQPLINKLIQAKKLVDGAVLFYNEGPIGFFKILAFEASQGGCYYAFDYVDDALVIAGSNSAGPVGAFAAYGVSKVAAYGVCEVMINALAEALNDYFNPQIYSNDPTVDRWVKIFYTGEIVDNTLPYDVNFFSRFGWQRSEILDKVKGPDKLNRALTRHLVNLWGKYPDLRQYLDIKGDVRSIDWDNEKSKEIWKIIFETANEDMAALIQEQIKNIPEPTRNTMDIEKYIAEQTTESWFGLNQKQVYGKVLVEHPTVNNEETVPEEFLIDDTVNMDIRFIVLGYAGHDENVSVEWSVYQTGWMANASIKNKTEDIKIRFPKDRIEDISSHIKDKSSEFSFKIDKQSFTPGVSYNMSVTLKNGIGIIRTFDFMFTVKSEGCKEKFATKLENIEKEITSIKEFSDGVQGKCAEIQKLLEDQQKQIDLEKKTISEIKTQIKEFVEKIKNTEQAKEKLGEIDQKIEKLTVEIEDLVSDLGELSLKICEKTKTLNDHKIKDNEHEKTFQWIQKNKKELKIYLNKIKEHYKEIESHKQMISTIMNEYKTIKADERDSIDQSITKMDTLATEIDTTVAQVNQMLIDNLKDVSVLYSRKQAVKKSIKNLGEACEKELESDIKRFNEQLTAIKISRCSKELESKIKNLESNSKSIKKESTALTKQMGENKKKYKEYSKNIKKIESLKKDREVTILLADNYLQRGKRFAVDGAFCVVLSEEIMKKVFIPNVIGMKFIDALSTLSRKGLNNISEGNIKQTLSKELERKVFNQSPQTKKRVKKETKITLDHYASYGDTIESLIAQKNCPNNTVKVWNESLKGVECVCQGPVFVWNKSETACITQEQAALEEKNDAMAKADCPREYPGSINSWNSITKKVDCICLGPTLVWNKANNACITQKEAALEKINCSQWPGSKPGYFNGKAGCVCVKPLVRSQKRAACITQEEAALENANCQNGKVAILDNGIVKCQCPQNKFWSDNLGKCATSYELSQDCNHRFPGSIPSKHSSGCSCPNGTTWVKGMNRCANSDQISQFCKQQFPGSVPQWDYQNNKQACVCPKGSQPMNNRCVKQNTQEICGDGIDNNGNNQIDEGCNFNLEVILDDDECPDDTMALIIDGYNYGNNPAGHKRHYNVTGLLRGKHTIEVYGVKSGGKAYKDKRTGRSCANNDIITYSIEFGYGIKAKNGRKKSSSNIREGKSKSYTITVQ